MTLREFLFENKIKQIELAHEIGIDPSRLSKFVKWQFALTEKHMLALSEKLGISKEELAADKFIKIKTKHSNVQNQIQQDRRAGGIPNCS